MAFQFVMKSLLKTVWFNIYQLFFALVGVPKDGPRR
jgi:hypothetical protein